MIKNITGASKVKEGSETSGLSDASQVEENVCVVCFRTVEIYSIGDCDHPVCYECSTRLRVLCEQNECPICRHVLAKVIFAYDKLSYRELEAKNRSEYYNKKYKISFYNNQIQKAFFNLLDHPCPQCEAPPYRTFQGLKHHVRKEHDMHFCDICTDNLKIFTYERRCYTQTELGLHRTKGDVDNRSHRGHPLCEYCNKRFLDRDELFRHLRREHYYCHFCDADGCNEFYKDYDALAEHFRRDHYLCEEGNCATEQFIGAFRTEIDYKAHVGNVHGKFLNKQQAKQTRTLQLEITLGPRGRTGQTAQNYTNVRSRDYDNNEEVLEEQEELFNIHQNQRATTSLDTCNERDFPSLAGAANGPNISLVQPIPQSMRYRSTAGLARTKENFPALGGGVEGFNSVTQRSQTQQGQNISTVLRKTPSAATGAIARTGPAPATANANPSGMIIHVSNRPTQNSPSSTTAKKPVMDFPALPGGKGKKVPRDLDDDILQPSLYKSMTKVAHNPLVTTRAVARTSPASAASNVNPGMTMHVSNRSTQNNPSSTNAKKPILDFPALRGGKGKKVPRDLDEDMILTDTSMHMPNVAAKHRQMIEDYVSVANPSNFQKLQMVEKEEIDAKTRIAAEKKNPANFKSQDFPSLGDGSGKNSAPTQSTWLKTSDKKQRELENRKAKVAPPPLLPKENKATTPAHKPQANNNFPQLTDSSTKKEKKSKEKKATAENSSQQNKGNPNGKSKEKYNNSENKAANMNLNHTPSKPTLVANGNNGATVQMPPPPGFSYVKPPPGFQTNVTVNSIAKSPNNLTFTSSLGESYNIVSSHTYIQPPEAVSRNQLLVTHFNKIFKFPEALDEFRLISTHFREGIYKADAYYEHCQAALKDTFDAVFPEFLAMLPDISKQQALYLVHTQHLNTMSPNKRKSLPKLEVCPTCKQVLLGKDVGHHLSVHKIRDHFPTLGNEAPLTKNHIANRK